MEEGSQEYTFKPEDNGGQPDLGFGATEILLKILFGLSVESHLNQQYLPSTTASSLFTE